SAYASVSSSKNHASVTDPSRTNADSRACVDRFAGIRSETPTLLDHLPDRQACAELVTLAKPFHLLNRVLDVFGGFLGGRRQQGDRHTPARDEDFLALGNPSEQLGQVGLGLVGSDGVHGMGRKRTGLQTSLLSRTRWHKAIEGRWSRGGKASLWPV